MELAFLALGVLLCGPVIAMVALVRVNRLRGEVAALRKSSAAPQTAARPPVAHPYRNFGAFRPDAGDAPPVSRPERQDADRSADRPSSLPRTPPPAPRPQPAASMATETPASPAATGPERRSRDFERLFGTHFAVWLGGIALAVAGVFLVKYSIDQNLLTPLNRVVLGGIAGLGLLGAGVLVRERPRIANARRIAQALTGAGIAVLYVALYAASDLYELLPSPYAFVGMIVTTVAAVGLSVRHGKPIALLGIAGGYATPVLVGSNDPNALVLFTYLFVLFTGLMAVVRRRGWWNLALVSLIGALIWIPVYLAASPDQTTPILLTGYLLAIGVVGLAGSWLAYTKLDWDRGLPVNNERFLLVWGIVAGVIGLAALVTVADGHSLEGWSMFALVAAGAYALMVIDGRLYGPAPLLAAAVTLGLFLAWKPGELTAQADGFGIYVTLFGAGFTAGGYAVLARVRPLVYPVGLAAFASLAFYLLAFFHFRELAIAPPMPLFWGLVAFASAAAAILALRYVLEETSPDRDTVLPLRDYAIAILAVLAATSIALGVAIEVERDFLGLAFAAQLLAVVWINRRLRLPVLGGIALVLSGIFALLLLPQMILLLRLTAAGTVGVDLPIQESVPFVDSPVFQLGVPAVMFLLAAREQRRIRDDRFVFGLEAAAIGLIGMMGYYLSRHAFHADANVLLAQVGFLERGVTTNILFAFGLVCMWLGGHFARPAFTWSGLALAGVALFRIAVFDLVVKNPLWTADTVGGVALLNPLLLPFGLGAAFTLVLAWLVARTPTGQKVDDAVPWLRGFAVVLLFALVSMNVRHIFQAPRLDIGMAGNGEIYTYSVVWLLFGLALLAFGIWTRDRMARLASLAVMLLTVGKVFLFDAASTEGLFRVLSFVALGLSLIGLSVFYSRYVFRREDQQAENPPPPAD